MENIIEEIKEERKRQDRIWGEQNHHPERWLRILMEEVGEASEASLEAYPVKEQIRDRLFWLKKYRTELTHVAAVAIAAIECFDREDNNDK